MLKLQPHIEKAKRDGNALDVFGLILFTDAHPHVVKVLRDDDYWNALSESAGDNFAVFSAKPSGGRPGRVKIEGIDIPLEALEPPEPKNTLFHPLWELPSKNCDLLEAFNISDEGLPKFVVFAENANGGVLQCSISLSDEGERAAYERLRKVVDACAGVANNIATEYRHDTSNVYAAFERNFREIKEREMLVNLLSWAPFLSKLYEHVT